MKKLDEHSQWEDEWADAFENARRTPPPSVWNNIQAVQADKEANKYKKRIIFYKWLAAASVFISVCSASLLMLNSDEAGFIERASNNSASEQIPVVTPLQENSADNPLAENLPSQVQDDQRGKGRLQVAGESGKNESSKDTESTGSLTKAEPSKKEAQTDTPEIPTSSSAMIASSTEGENRDRGQSFVLAEEGQGQATVAGTSMAKAQANTNSNKSNTHTDKGEKPGLSAFDSRLEEDLPAGEALATEEDKTVESSSGAVPVFFMERKELLALEVQQDSKVSAEIRKLWVASNFFKEEKEKSAPKFMLGASLASNSFNANYLDNSPEIAVMAANLETMKPAKGSTLSTARITDWDEEQKSIMSVAGAVQGAAWVSKRWVVQGGLQYGNYKTSGTASTFTDQQENISYPLHFSNYSPDKIEAASFRGRSSSTIDATNTFEFLSVPLSIGYVVVDRRISLLLSPGISSEFFLSNQLKAEEVNNLNAFTVPNGEESPFNFVHFRGLISAQLFYKMSDNYLISLEPGYQHAITDFNKSDTFFSSRPSNISFAAGFRYIFH